MSKLEDKTVEIMDKAMIGAEKLTEKMAELAVQYGPDVVNAAVEVARIEAASGLIRPFFLFAFSAPISVYAIKKMIGLDAKIAKFKEVKNSHRYPLLEGDQHAEKVLGYPNPSGSMLFYSVVLGLSIGFATVNGYALTHIWNWVGIFEPKLWIAHRILEKAL
jgi:hypothetical protein